jgi:predicted RNase H-like nuclease
MAVFAWTPWTPQRVASTLRAIVGPVTAGQVAAPPDSSGSPAPQPVAGIDGCRAGWVLVTAHFGQAGARSSPGVEIRVVHGLETVVDALTSGQLAAAGIDIPIGLRESQPRLCDIECRRRLGPRRSSVFPAPARSVLAAGTYDEACALSRRACDKGISKQLYNILPKIREVDAVMATNPGLQDQLFEMCPELSFALLADAPMAHGKRSAAGRHERVATLRGVFGDVDDLVAHPPAGAQSDDVFDALVGAWTARRRVTQQHLQLGAGHDDRNLPMQIVA